MEDTEIPRMLVIEDEPDVASAIERLLKKHFSARVERAPDAKTAKRRLESTDFDIVTLDYQLPDTDGLTMLREIVGWTGAPPVIMVTGHGDEDIAANALRFGASGYVQKDGRITALLVEAVKKALLASRLRRAEQELLETREYLESLLEYANAPIIVWDPQLNITRFNRAFERLTGYRSSEVIGKKLTMLFPTETRLSSLDKIAHAVSGEFWETVEIPILRHEGDSRLVMWNSANIYDKVTDELVATIAQGQDITEQRSSQEALKKTLREYAQLIEASNSVILRIDVKGRIAFVNTYGLEFFGYSAAELIGMNVLGTIVPAVDSDGNETASTVVDPANGPDGFVLSMKENMNKDGERVFLSWSNRVWYDDNGEIAGTLAIGNDVTELRRTGIELERHRTDQ